MPAPLAAIQTNEQYYHLTTDAHEQSKADDDKITWVDSPEEIVAILQEKYPQGDDWATIQLFNNGIRINDTPTYRGNDFQRALELADQFGQVDLTKEFSDELRQRFGADYKRVSRNLEFSWATIRKCHPRTRRTVYTSQLTNKAIWHGKRGCLHYGTYRVLMHAFLLAEFQEQSTKKFKHKGQIRSISCSVL